MRPQDQVAQAKRAKRTRRALQVATCLSVLVLSCSVYDTSLLSGSLRDGDAGSSGSSGAGIGGLPDDSGGAPSEGGRTGQAGEQDQGTAGDPGGGEGGALEVETGGSGVIVNYGGASGNDGSVGGAGTGGAVAGSAGASSAGAAGSPPVVHELAKNKKATASSNETANPVAKGNDGDSATRWCAISAAMPQWWRVDLVDTHLLTQVVLKFEHPERKYAYVIETSPNDAVYTQRAMVTGTSDTQTIDMPANVSARYVRITVTGAVPYTDSGGKVYATWASFWEMRVYGY
jgi:F5/8 type C domain